ncbi:MAG: Kynurenine formamidase [Bacteroidota bacterium]|jgi:kynurenine formamidase
MIFEIKRGNHPCKINLVAPFADLSLPVSDIARAWYIEPPRFSPVVLGEWVGSVAQGSSVNFFNIEFNPHAHGTHTETAGHITEERHPINAHFKDPMMWALLLSVDARDGKVQAQDFRNAWENAENLGWTEDVKAVIFRTEPIIENVTTRNYSSTDWPYLEAEIGQFLRENGIDHLLIDQPSVDQEEDGGALACHRSFWGPSPELSLHRTISELLYIPKNIEDGPYLLNLQVAPMNNDAAPSRPLLYKPL